MRKIISLGYSFLIWLALIAAGIGVIASLSDSEPLPPDYVGEDPRGWVVVFGLIFIIYSIFPFFAFIGKLIAFKKESRFGRWFWALPPLIFDIISAGMLAYSAITSLSDLSLFSIVITLLAILGIASVVCTLKVINE